MSQQTNIPGVYKESEGVLINKDNDALAAYKLRKQRDLEFVQLKKDVVELKNDIQEIKDLLKGLVK